MVFMSLILKSNIQLNALNNAFIDWLSIFAFENKDYKVYMISKI